MKHARISGLAAFLGALPVPTLVQAQLGNLTYTQQELFQPISKFDDQVPHELLSQRVIGLGREKP